MMKLDKPAGGTLIEGQPSSICADPQIAVGILKDGPDNVMAETSRVIRIIPVRVKPA